MNGYIEVSKETLEEVSRLTGLEGSFFWEKELAQAENFDQAIVVFELDGKMVSTRIDRHYNVPFVMKQKFGLEPYNGDVEAG